MHIVFATDCLSTSVARRQLDSNQRAVFRPYGFAARRIRPLCHTVSLPARPHCSTSSRIVHETYASRLRHAGGVKFFIIRYACACMLFVKVHCSSISRHRRGPPSFLSVSRRSFSGCYRASQPLIDCGGMSTNRLPSRSQAVDVRSGVPTLALIRALAAIGTICSRVEHHMFPQYSLRFR